MPRLEHTSVPAWAVPGHRGPGDPEARGTSYVLVGIGANGREQVAAWAGRLAPYDVRSVVGDDAASAGEALGAALGTARVGVRVWIAGPVGGCLAARAVAVRCGVEDDELHVAPVEAGDVDLHCVHCGTVTATGAGIDDVVACGGCDRRLLVYYHVSRRTGRFLGFQVDAEECAS